MTSPNIYIPLQTLPFTPKLLEKGSWLAIVHSQRIPPHVGMLFSGNYNSLTIKEAEINISSAVFLKMLSQKKIKTLFLKLAHHPVFSLDHQMAIFQEQLKKFGCVKNTKATCLSPIKLFFSEFYALPLIDKELLLDFILRLKENNFIDFGCGLNVELNDGVELPFYSSEELNDKITSERSLYYNI